MSEASGTSRWFRLNLWVHRWSSLVATLPFLVLCVTGSVLIFHEEIDAALGVVPTSSAGEARIAACMDTVRREFPEERVLSVGLDPVGHPGVFLAVVAPPEDTGFDRARLVFLELESGRLLGDEDPASTFTGWMLELHAEWFLGGFGRLLGALIALLVLASLGSSLVLYGPFMRRLAHGVIRRGRGARLTQLDLHNFIGAVVLGWALVVTVSGFFLGFSSIALGLWQYTDLAEIREEFADAPAVDPLAPPASVEQVLATVEAASAPGWGVRTILFPGTDLTTPRHYGVLSGGSEGLDARLMRVSIVDAQTGELSRELALPAYLQAIFLFEPLHFGDYGGLPLKLLWTLCNLLTLFITANGAWLFFDRRRARTLRPAREPSTERPTASTESASEPTRDGATS